MTGRLILSDFDGTIVSSLKVVVEIMNGLSKKYSLQKISKANIGKFRNKGIKEVIKEAGIPVAEIPFFVRDLRKRFHSHIRDVSLVKGIKKVFFDAKKQGFEVMILTSNSKENIDHLVKKYKLVFDDIYTGSPLFGKARIIKKVLREKGIGKENAVYIGDEIRDIEAARQSGVRSIAVCWGVNSEGALKKAGPDFVARNPSDLAEILKML